MNEIADLVNKKIIVTMNDERQLKGVLVALDNYHLLLSKENFVQVLKDKKMVRENDPKLFVIPNSAYQYFTSE